MTRWPFSFTAYLLLLHQLWGHDPLFAVLILISLLEGLTIVLMGLPPGIAAIVVAALALLVGVLVRWGWMRRRRRRI